MKKPLALFALVVFMAACASVPFQETPLVSYESRDPDGVVIRFQSTIPVSFQLLTTVVFEYNGQAFSGIGTLEINTKDRGFIVACMNPMGVKLFEIVGDDRGITTRYAIAALTRYGNIAAAVGNDIQRVYFDLVPSMNAESWKTKYRLVFRQPSGPGYLEFVFAGTEGDLIEKRYYEDHVLAWQVSYYEYRDQQGKRYPRGIILVNYQYGYRLTVRQKEFRF